MTNPRYFIVVALLLVSANVRSDPSVSFWDGKIAIENKDYQSAERIWLSLAQQGDVNSQFQLAGLYDQGLAGGGNRDEDAFRWYEKAALQGHREASYNLGNAYKKGRGIQHSESLAVYWWQKAADAGLASAQFNLAIQYYRGWGIEQDNDKAIQYFNLAAHNGHDKAMRLLDTGKIPRLPQEQLPLQPPPQPSSTPLAATVAARQPEQQLQPLAPEQGEQQTAQSQQVALAGQSYRLGGSFSPGLVSVVTEQKSAAEQNMAPESATVIAPVEQKLSWLDKQDARHFCIQLAVITQKDNIQPFLQKYQLSQRVNVAEILRGGQLYYYLLLGDFGDRGSAAAAIEFLPAGVQQLKPWPRQFADLQSLGDH